MKVCVAGWLTASNAVCTPSRTNTEATEGFTAAGVASNREQASCPVVATSTIRRRTQGRQGGSFSAHVDKPSAGTGWKHPLSDWRRSARHQRGVSRRAAEPLGDSWQGYKQGSGKLSRACELGGPSGRQAAAPDTRPIWAVWAGPGAGCSGRGTMTGRLDGKVRGPQPDHPAMTTGRSSSFRRRWVSSPRRT
jgi:hypothetical protein